MCTIKGPKVVALRKNGMALRKKCNRNVKTVKNKQVRTSRLEECLVLLTDLGKDLLQGYYLF